MEEKEAKRRIAEEFISSERAKISSSNGFAAGSIPPLDIESDPDKLKHMLFTDIRDSLPPQVFALIGMVADKLKSNLEEK